MRRILILSDTHGYVDERILHYCSISNEVWHVGDIGSIEVIDKISWACTTFRAVYGNIDGWDIRKLYPEVNYFELEHHRVLMTHICGYPGKYAKGVKELISKYKPTILLGGHSHILKVQRDADNNLLYINPGAAGIQGFHIHRTMVQLEIDASGLKNVSVVEIGLRSSITKS